MRPSERKAPTISPSRAANAGWASGAFVARVETDENSLQRGLAQLVLVLVEILGELLERQAVRRMAAGSISDEESEKLGAAFLALHKRVDELYDELVGDSGERPLFGELATG